MKYINKVDITSGRRLHIAEPIDDRLIFVDAADILQDLTPQNSRHAAWYEGLFAYCMKEHAIYVWLDANGNNPNVPYNRALLPNNYDYDVAYPDDDYKGRSFNWYPILGGGAGGFYFNTEPTSATNLEGWPEGTIPNGPHNIQYMWDKLLYPYVPPAVVLSSQPAATYYEKGVVLNPIQLIANNEKGKLDIIQNRFFRDGVLIFTETNPDPTGVANSLYTDTVDVGPTNDVVYQADVSDSQQTELSNRIEFKFVYPFYIGNLTSTNPSEAQIKALQKFVTPKKNQQFVHNFTQERYVIAYPQAYGELDHIYDTNRFETIDDYTLLTETFTMLDGASVPYYIYVFNFLTDAVDFTNYFEF